jgi:ABC-type molybdenum transport system ATPase subunit/photorepair protein PhrA
LPTRIGIFGKPLDIVVTSGERILISGENGSGKTTLIKLFRAAEIF